MPKERKIKIRKIFLASDHAGFKLKEEIKEFLKNTRKKVLDLGTNNDHSVDYPDFGVKLVEAIFENQIEKGILICGTGIGMSIVVNRFPGIRGTLCTDIYTAKMCRKHNDSNILILGGRVVGKGLAAEIVETWLITNFEGGRHQRRLDKINELDTTLKSKSLGQTR